MNGMRLQGSNGLTAMGSGQLQSAGSGINQVSKGLQFKNPVKVRPSAKVLSLTLLILMLQSMR